MSKYLSVLAFVKTHIDDGKTIWESLIFLVAKLILQKEIQTINSETLCNEFNDYYGFNLPLHPMNEIINKMCHKNFIIKGGSNLIPNKEKMIKVSYEDKQYETYYDDLLNDIKEFFLNKYSITIENNEIETLLIKYLDDYDVDILSSLNISSKFPELSIDLGHYYILNRYLIENCCDSEKINKLFHLIIANICVNSIFYSKSKRNLNLYKTYLYLDTRILLRLSGLEGDFRKSEYTSMIELLLSCKAKLRLFESHYNEILGIFDDCIHWLQKKDQYNPRFASPALKYFVENNYKISDVILFKDSIDKLLKQYSIKIDNYNYSDKSDYEFSIDESKLYNLIVEEYKKGSYLYEETQKENIVWTDVKAISSIFKKRKGLKPNSIEGISHAFLTINSALSRASRQYLILDDDGFYQYQECMTDTFYASHLWLNTSFNNEIYVRKRIIANSMSYIELNPELKRKYILKLKELKEKNNLDEDTFYFMRSHQLPLDLLEEKTYNISENYSDKLPEEIYEEIKFKISAPFSKELTSIKEEYSKNIIDSQEKDEKVLKYIEKKAKRFMRFIATITIILILSPSIILIFRDFISNIIIKVIMNSLSLIFSLILTYLSVTIKSIPKKIYSWKLNKLLQELSLK